MIQHDKIKENRHKYRAFLRNVPKGYLNMINNKDIESVWTVIVPHIIQSYKQACGTKKINPHKHKPYWSEKVATSIDSKNEAYVRFRYWLKKFGYNETDEITKSCKKDWLEKRTLCKITIKEEKMK